MKIIKQKFTNLQSKGKWSLVYCGSIKDMISYDVVEWNQNQHPTKTNRN